MRWPSEVVVLALAAILLAASSAHAYATILTFDDLTAGDPIGTYQGFKFATGTHVLADPSAVSAPNVAANLPQGGFFSIGEFGHSRGGIRGTRVLRGDRRDSFAPATRGFPLATNALDFLAIQQERGGASQGASSSEFDH
jgi:hypothetical protein